MARTLLAVSAVLLATLGPAFAIAPHCEDQLRQLSAQIEQQAGGNQGLKAKYDEAQRLCQQHQDQQAEDLARQIRQELARNQSGGGQGETSGSSAPESGTSPQK